MNDTKPSLSSQLYEVLNRKLLPLQSAYVEARSSAALSQLAALRRTAIESPGTDPEVWGLTLSDIPDALRGRGDAPSRAELSIHATLVLYAVHQQSRPTRMHQPGVPFGQAVARLAVTRGSGSEPDAGTIRKFHRTVTADHRPARLQELRSLMALLRGADIALDHAQLGVDLFRLESPNTRDSVTLRWGRDLHSRDSAPEDTSQPNNTQK